MSATDVVCPTLDEMIFAISQVNYSTASPPPSSIDRLSSSLDNAPQLSLTKTPINGDTGDTAIDDDTDDDEDDTDDDEDNLGMAVSAELDSSRLHRSQKSKHLVLLDLLALLLVTEAKSDVAATMLITNGSMKFFYSKNRPFTDCENKYVRTLFNYASQTDRNPIDRYKDLMATIVDKCQKKIKARISKVSRRVKELQSTADRGIHSESCLHSKVVKNLKARLKIDPEKSLKSFLISWCDFLNSTQHSKDPKFLRYAVSTAQSVGFSSEMYRMIDQKLLRRIRKLGDYLGAVIQLVGEIDRLPPQTLQTIVIQEVRTQVAAVRTL
ncbi:hypothetical protein BDD12DRAFT_856805 [Trichophaea hybrida]|nr:hypothetical protein BDD12DRAFT_856805 [Trichophaea hybrida]